MQTTVDIQYTLCLNNIPDIFDCNLKKNYQLLIIFDTNIPNTTGHQIIVQFPTSPNVCFCTTLGKQNQQNVTFLSRHYYYLITLTHKTYFAHISVTLADYSSNCHFFQLHSVKMFNMSVNYASTGTATILHSLTAVSIMFCSRPI